MLPPSSEPRRRGDRSGREEGESRSRAKSLSADRASGHLQCFLCFSWLQGKLRLRAGKLQNRERDSRGEERRDSARTGRKWGVGSGEAQASRPAGLTWSGQNQQGGQDLQAGRPQGGGNCRNPPWRGDGVPGSREAPGVLSWEAECRGQSPSEWQ